MNKIILPLAFAFYSTAVYTQVSDIAISKDGKPISITNVNNNVITTIKSRDVEGSPMLCDNWSKGSLRFKKGRSIDSLPLLFNLETNKLLFKQDSLTMEFLEEVEEFKFEYLEDGNSKRAFFRSNYPVIDQHTPLTYYSILTDGSKFQLLEFRQKKLLEQYQYNGPPKIKYKENQTFYIYDVSEKQMHSIKVGKSSLLKALPVLGSKINQLCNEHHWNLKTVDELQSLIQLLNE